MIDTDFMQSVERALQRAGDRDFSEGYQLGKMHGIPVNPECLSPRYQQILKGFQNILAQRAYWGPKVTGGYDVASSGVKGFWEGVAIHDLMQAYSAKAKKPHTKHLTMGLKYLHEAGALSRNPEVQTHLENIAGFHANNGKFLEIYREELGYYAEELKPEEQPTPQRSLKFTEFFDVS